MSDVYLRRRSGGGGPQERSPEIVGAHPFQEVGHQVEIALVGTGTAGIAPTGNRSQLLQSLSRRLEGLALQQASQQQIALRPQGQFLVQVQRLAVGQKAAALQLNQRGSDKQKFGGHFQIELLHAVEFSQIGVHDVAHHHLVEVNLVA